MSHNTNQNYNEIINDDYYIDESDILYNILKNTIEIGDIYDE